VTVIEVCCTHNAPVLHDCDGSERCTHNAPLFSLREATVLTTNSLPLPPLSYDGSPFYHPMDVPIQTSESLNPSPCIDPTKTRSISSLRRPSGVWAQINNSRPGTLPRFVDGWIENSLTTPPAYSDRPASGVARMRAAERCEARRGHHICWRFPRCSLAMHRFQHSSLSTTYLPAQCTVLPKA
jgi:hypothetical protein